MNLFILVINSKLDLMVSVAHLVLRDYYSIIPRIKESAIHNVDGSPGQVSNGTKRPDCRFPVGIRRSAVGKFEDERRG